MAATRHHAGLAKPTALTDDWRLLQGLGLYRLLLVTLLVSLQESDLLTQLFGQIQPMVFQWTCRAYALAALVLLLFAVRRKPGLSSQVMDGFGLDALTLAVLVFASGGVAGGLGVLLIPAVLGASLLLSSRFALLAAAVSVFVMFGQEAARQYPYFYSPADYTAVGLLGMMFFVTAIAGSAVARRVRASEAKAQKVGSEFADLSRLNEIVLDTMQTGVLVVDADNAIRLMNTAAARLIADTEPSIGIALSSLSPALTEALSRWREGRAAPESAIVPAHPGSSELLPRFRRLGAWADSPVLILLEDAARIRDQAQQIKLAALGRLSASIAHEIRNPLSAITHAGQLLAESPDLATQDRRLLDIVQRHGKRIDTIVKDVLNLSRAAAEPRDFLLLPWMQRTAQLYAEAHPGRNLTVTGEPGLQARFDPGHLQQVVFNLLDNAWLHGSRDGQPPEVHMQCRSLYLQGGALQVSDNGPGVAPETQEHLFEPFQTTSAQGTGLGLYLARELCAYNQGKLTYHAVPEGGAMFRITLIAPDATPMPKDD